MSIENSGADYLRRLKRNQEHQPRGYAEPDPTPEPVETAPPERRRNPRYKCEGSATFRVEGTNVRTWGTFTDLSCSGCYVELKASFPGGRDHRSGIGTEWRARPSEGRGACELSVSGDGRRLPRSDDGTSYADPGDDRVDPSCANAKISRDGT